MTSWPILHWCSAMPPPQALVAETPLVDIRMSVQKPGMTETGGTWLQFGGGWVVMQKTLCLNVLVPRIIDKTES